MEHSPERPSSNSYLYGGLSPSFRRVSGGGLLGEQVSGMQHLSSLWPLVIPTSVVLREAAGLIRERQLLKSVKKEKDKAKIAKALAKRRRLSIRVGPSP